MSLQVSVPNSLVGLGGSSPVIASVLSWHYNCGTGSQRKHQPWQEVSLSPCLSEPRASAAWVASRKVNPAGICRPLPTPSFGSVVLHGGGWYQPLASHVLPVLPLPPKATSQSKPGLGAAFPSLLQSWLPRAAIIRENHTQLYKPLGCWESGPCGAFA